MAKHVTGCESTKETGVREGKTLLEVVVGAADSLLELTFETGRQVLEKLLEADQERLCGRKGVHAAERLAYRHGHDDGVVVLGGRKVRVKKPRVRSVEGVEMHLPTYEQFSQEDPLLARVYEQLVVGVSTRKYARSLEPLPEDLTAVATSKSEVSRNFAARTEAQLEAFLRRPLDALDLPVMMIDGVYVGDHVLLVALGVDRDGHKQILGLWEGTTEHELTCRGLLRELIERGLKVEQPRLFVIDGGKGLRKAIQQVFGNWAVLARCRQHKVENVAGHVPKQKKAWVRSQLRRAYDSATVAQATKRLDRLAKSLEVSHPSAAASIREGQDETLTLLRLEVDAILARSLRTTNLIENINGTFRNVTRRVKRWRDGKMILRWGATALIEAQQRFQRVKGYRQLPRLISSLAAICSSRSGSTRENKRKIA